MKKIMIVDDSLFVYEEMKHMLNESEFEIEAFVKSGEEAIDAYEKADPDVITMDVVLPGMDGIEAAEIILKKWPDAKLVIVSSLAYDDTIKRAKNIGIKHFLFKPIEKEALIKELNEAIEV